MFKKVLTDKLILYFIREYCYKDGRKIIVLSLEIKEQLMGFHGVARRLELKRQALEIK